MDTEKDINVKEDAPKKKASPKSAELKAQLSEAEEKLSALNDTYLRMLAEYDNYKKRTTNEKMSIYGDATVHTVQQFLPVVDSLEMALSASCSDAEYKKGIELIMNGLKSVLEKLHVEEINPLGEQFDPNFHNAVMSEESDELESGSVSLVLQKGYKIGDKIVRHAMVKVVS